MRHRTRDRTFFGSRPTRTEMIVLRTKRDGHECLQDATQTKARTNPPAFYRKKTTSSSSRNPTQNLLSSLTYIYRKLNERRRRSTDSSISRYCDPAAFTQRTTSHNSQLRQRATRWAGKVRVELLFTGAIAAPSAAHTPAHRPQRTWPRSSSQLEPSARRARAPLWH